MVDRRAFTPSDPETREKIWRDEVASRLETLESAQGLRNASVKGGAITVWSRGNKQVSRMGKGSYVAGGNARESITLAASTEDGGFHLLIDTEEGWVAPRITNSFVQDTFVAVTSGSYVGVWKSAVTLTGTTLVCDVVVGVDASTTGNIRLNVAGINSDAVACPAGAFTTCKFSWDLEGRVGLGGTHIVRVQAQRASGSGNVNVYSPDYIYAATKSSRNDSTTGGIASV